MKYRPIRSHAIVKIKIDKKSAGGIVLLEHSKENMAKEEGTIIAMGPDMFIDSNPGDQDQVKVGDVVAFARYGGKSLGIDKDGDEIRVMRDIDILAVKEEE